MVVGLRDIYKMIGIFIISCCAVFICTLFLNYNIDLNKIDSLITTEPMQQFYDAQLMTGTVVIAVSGGCLLLTSVVMLFFYIKNYIDTHKKEMGILKALGYSNYKIASGFWVFGLSVLIGTVIGYCGSHVLMTKFYAVQNDNDILPAVIIHFHPLLVFYLIVLPTVFFSLLSVLYSYYKLHTSVQELLKGKTQTKVKITTKDSNLSFLQELRKNTVKQRKSLVFFIVFATFCYSDMIQMSCSMDEFSSIMMAIMVLLIGIILACVTLFLAITTVVNANRKTIVMMQVFGYNKNECTRAILGGYRPFAYIGFAIGTVYQYALLKIMVSVVFKDIENVPEYNFDVVTCGITLISFMVMYELIMYGYSRRIGKISIKEIMLE